MNHTRCVKWHNTCFALFGGFKFASGLEDYAMQVSYTKCRSCGESVRTSAKFCFRCGKSARPLPVFWFTFLSGLFVTYVILDTYSLV